MNYFAVIHILSSVSRIGFRTQVGKITRLIKIKTNSDIVFIRQLDSIESNLMYIKSMEKGVNYYNSARSRNQTAAIRMSLIG